MSLEAEAKKKKKTLKKHKPEKDSILETQLIEQDEKQQSSSELSRETESKSS